MIGVTHRTIGFAALTCLVLFSVGRAALAQDKVVRMGNQKVGAFALLKARGILEERLKPLGYTVTWKEFPGGPQLLEGMKPIYLCFSWRRDINGSHHRQGPAL